MILLTNPFFSPDGKRIAFNAYRKGQMGIYAMNADGSDERPITRLGRGPGQCQLPNARRGSVRRCSLLWL